MTSTGAGGLPTAQIGDVTATRLAEGLIPPTNRWYSGLVFGDEPQPVFPFPLAFAARGNGFTVDLPTVTASPNTIATPFAGGLDILLPSSSFEIVRYDPVSVTLEYADEAGALGQTTIAEGSPVVSFAASRDVVVETSEPLEPAADGVWQTRADDTYYAVRAPGATYGASGSPVNAPTSTAVPAVPDASTRACARSRSGPRYSPFGLPVVYGQ